MKIPAYAAWLTALTLGVAMLLWARAPGASAAPDRPPAALVARTADGALHWWGTLSPDHETPREHRAHGCAVTVGAPAAAEENAFHAARGDPPRGMPRCEVRLDAAGALAGYGYGAVGCVGPPPAGGRVEAREPTETERSDLAVRQRRQRLRDAAIGLQARAAAAAALGLAAEADALAAQARAALAEAQR